LSIKKSKDHQYASCHHNSKHNSLYITQTGSSNNTTIRFKNIERKAIYGKNKYRFPYHYPVIKPTLETVNDKVGQDVTKENDKQVYQQDDPSWVIFSKTPNPRIQLHLYTLPQNQTYLFLLINPTPSYFLSQTGKKEVL